jgi:hypothetical protein
MNERNVEEKKKKKMKVSENINEEGYGEINGIESSSYIG